MRFQPFAGSTQSRSADGKNGETVEKAVWGGQVGALQTPGKKDQKDDPERQKTRRTDASEAAEQPIFLLVQMRFIPIQAEKFMFFAAFLPWVEKNRKKVQNFSFL